MALYLFFRFPSLSQRGWNLMYLWGPEHPFLSKSMKCKDKDFDTEDVNYAILLHQIPCLIILALFKMLLFNLAFLKLIIIILSVDICDHLRCLMQLGRGLIEVLQQPNGYENIPHLVFAEENRSLEVTALLILRIILMQGPKLVTVTDTNFFKWFHQVLF